MEFVDGVHSPRVGFCKKKKKKRTKTLETYFYQCSILKTKRVISGQPSRLYRQTDKQSDAGQKVIGKS